MNFLVLCFISNLVIINALNTEECQRQADDDIIWEYDVRRSYMIGTYQEVEARYGPTDVIITCIGINSLSDENNGAVWVTDGGVGHNYVKIKFRSKYSRGLRYRVFAYGKVLQRRTSLWNS